MLIARPVQGRITEFHLPDAERSFPGISAMYEQMKEKPATFLQLLWHYEGEMQRAEQSDRDDQEC